LSVRACGVLLMATMRPFGAPERSTQAWRFVRVAPPPRPPATDRHRNHPATWSQRHALVLQLHLKGWRASEIAVELRYSPHRVSMIVNSPLFEERKAALLRELSGKSRGPYLDAVERDAVANFDFLCSLRDDETKPMHERMRAAQSIARLADLVLPRGRRE
jgi:hypothetical protein